MSTWASDQPGAQVDWIEFNVKPAEGEKARHVKANVSFLLSNWTCIWGSGCPSTLINGASRDGGCCQIGVHVNNDELKRLKGYVGKLTEDDADYIDRIRDKWTRRDPESEDENRPRKTRTVNGGCIFLNRIGGVTGKPGCAFHHLAERLGVHFAEVKPDICWQIPISCDEDWDENSETMTFTVSFTAGSTWGTTESDTVHYPGYWCTETPDAYRGKKPVYKSMEYELRKMLGDETYEELVRQLKAVGKPRHPMPGAVTDGGRPLIPLLVNRRLELWREEGMHKEIARTANDVLR